jgi:predicted nucleic acid-binding protein
MIVVDTNIICLRWLPAVETAQAETLLERDPDWATALLWRWEFRNALAGYIRRGSLTTAAATSICASAEAAMAQNEFRAPAGGVFDLVAHSACTAYDCEFVAVARERGVPLITADREILREFPHIAVSLDKFLSS